VSSALNGQILPEFTKEEIYHALQQMALLKSPGPDGFPVGF
jgi:hypothetical protein